MKNFPGLHRGLINDHLPTFHAMSMPPGHTPIKIRSATSFGSGSGKGMTDSRQPRMLTGIIAALRNTNVAILLMNK
jgi:hypothetical protein